MSTPWEDRRGMFQRGKEVHDPARRPSQSGGVVEAVRRASVSSQSSLTKPLSNDPAAPASPTGQRRRSSAASGGLFGNLTQHKRGSEDYETRRASHSEQLQSGGAVSGWYNKTFRGIAKPADTEQEQGKSTKRGVME